MTTRELLASIVKRIRQDEAHGMITTMPLRAPRPPRRMVKKGHVLFILPSGKVTADVTDDGVLVGEALENEHAGSVLVCTDGPASAPHRTMVFEVER